jgi:serine protease
MKQVLAVAFAAALLAGCGGGSSQIVPGGAAGTAKSASSTRTLTMLSRYTAVGPNGSILRIFPTREALGVGGGSGGPLLYGGGPIQTAPKLYVVFWGSGWNSTAGDPNGVMPVLKNFYAAIGGGKWLNSVTQYTQSGGAHAGNAGSIFAGSYVDTTSSPLPVPLDSDIAAEAVKAAAHFGDYSASAAYVVALPHNTIPVGFMAQYCAWHSSTAAAGGTIAYTNLPYMPDAGSSCGQGSVNVPGTLDGVSIVAGHEQGETESDPQPSTGWTDASGAENGDKCAWTGLENNPNAGGFPTQPLWSNAGNSCVQAY